MDLKDRYSELLKLKRRQLFVLLQKRYNQIILLNDLVSEKNKAVALVIWRSESRSKDRRFKGGTISTIKYTIDDWNRIDSTYAANNIVIAELFIDTYEKALIELASGRRITEKKTISMTLPIEYWYMIDQICYHKNISYAGFFRDLAAKELGDGTLD